MVLVSVEHLQLEQTQKKSQCCSAHLQLCHHKHVSRIPRPGHPAMPWAARLSGHHTQRPAEASPHDLSSESSFFWEPGREEAEVFLS